MTNIWKDLEEFPDYEISESGDIRNIKTQHLLRTHVNQNGAVMCGFRVDKKRYTRSIHILVAKTFLEEPLTPGLIPWHIDGDQTNNHFRNLKWKQRWFVRDNRRERKRGPSDLRQIRNINTGVVYENAMVIAEELERTERMVLNAAGRNHEMILHGCRYEFV